MEKWHGVCTVSYTHLIVCPGVHIGRRCIIGAGSVVVHDIPDDCLAVGNPAVIKKRLR